MSTLTVGYGNVGRTDHGSSHAVDKDALQALHDAMPDHRAAVLLCEIGEGDANNELALAKRIFKGWTFYAQASREPIALSPDFGRARSRVVWVPETAVKKWSPPRSVNLVHIPDENTTLIGTHPAAGAYHGERPEAARRELIRSWDKTFATWRLIEASLHVRGRNVAWAADVNRNHMPDVVGGEREVFCDVTDHGRVLPADGWHAETKYLGRVDFRVDSHDGHHFRVRFTEKE